MAKYSIQLPGKPTSKIVGTIEQGATLTMTMNDVTQIIEAVSAGKACATKDLLPIIYEDLRHLAMSKLSHESSDHTLQPTALVHEAYVRLVGSSSKDWENRGHFFSAAAEAMRRILIDHARRKKRQKRGGNAKRLELNENMAIQEAELDELIALNEALSELEAMDKTKADLVKLKFFAGMTLKEAAAALDVPLRTAERHWAYSRAWLHKQVAESSD